MRHDRLSGVPTPRLHRQAPLNWCLAWVTLVVLIAFLPARALGKGKPGTGLQKAAKAAPEETMTTSADVSMEYSDNVFGLSGTQKARLEAGDPDDIVSRRFQSMDAISDVTLSPTVRTKFRSGKKGRGNVDVTAWLSYHRYSRNDQASYPEGGVKLKRSCPGGGKLTLEGKVISGFFKKNYLSAYADDNSNGNVSREERVYSPATYDEYEGKIAFEKVLVKARGQRLSRLSVEPFAGYRWRKFRSGFGNRDLDLPRLGLGIDCELASRFDLDVEMEYEKALSPAGQELFLYDETVSGIDANGDGRWRSHAPCQGIIDRSSTRKSLEVTPSLTLAKGTSLFCGFGWRTESYSSGQPLDVGHYAQEAFRRKIKAGVRWKASMGTSVVAEFHRTNEGDGDDDEYSEKTFQVALAFDLD